MSPVKEPNFFSWEDIESQNLYYKGQNIKTAEEYGKLFEDALKNQKKGEASVSYLFYPNVPKRIKKSVPEAKIIILLRNPVERAFSHYLMDMKLGYVSLSFDDVIFRNIKSEKLQLYFQQYVELGLYYEQVERYYQEFGKENVFVILSEDMFKDPQVIFQTLCDFLDISHIDNPDFKKYNEFALPSSKLIKIFYTSFFLKNLLKAAIPNRGMRDLLKKKFFTVKEKPQMSEQSKRFLKEFYKENIKKLEKLIGRDLSVWDADHE